MLKQRFQSESEVDVRLFNNPISIKTKTGTSYSGVKLIWTVDAQNAQEFRDSYSPSFDIIFTQIVWSGYGGLFYIPLESQIETFREIGREQYIKLPSLGTNPRGVEITLQGLQKCLNHQKTLKIDINWKREEIQYNPFKR